MTKSPHGSIKSQLARLSVGDMVLAEGLYWSWHMAARRMGMKILTRSVSERKFMVYRAN